MPRSRTASASKRSIEISAPTSNPDLRTDSSPDHPPLPKIALEDMKLPYAAPSTDHKPGATAIGEAMMASFAVGQAPLAVTGNRDTMRTRLGEDFDVVYAAPQQPTQRQAGPARNQSRKKAKGSAHVQVGGDMPQPNPRPPKIDLSKEDLQSVRFSVNTLVREADSAIQKIDKEDKLLDMTNRPGSHLRTPPLFQKAPATVPPEDIFTKLPRAAPEPPTPLDDPALMEITALRTEVATLLASTRNMVPPPKSKPMQNLLGRSFSDDTNPYVLSPVQTRDSQKRSPRKLKKRLKAPKMDYPLQDYASSPLLQSMPQTFTTKPSLSTPLPAFSFSSRQNLPKITTSEVYSPNSALELVETNSFPFPNMRRRSSSMPSMIPIPPIPQSPPRTPTRAVSFVPSFSTVDHDHDDQDSPKQPIEKEDASLKVSGWLQSVSSTPNPQEQDFTQKADKSNRRKTMIVPPSQSPHPDMPSIRTQVSPPHTGKAMTKSPADTLPYQGPVAITAKRPSRPSMQQRARSETLPSLSRSDTSGSESIPTKTPPRKRHPINFDTDSEDDENDGLRRSQEEAIRLGISNAGRVPAIWRSDSRLKNVPAAKSEVKRPQSLRSNSASVHMHEEEQPRLRSRVEQLRSMRSEISSMYSQASEEGNRDIIHDFPMPQRR